MKTSLAAPEIVLYGLSHHEASLKEREPWANEDQIRALQEVLRALPGVHEVACLTTCNRTEFYLVSEETDPSFFSRELQAAFPNLSQGKAAFRVGEEAVRHLFRVASGSDSMMVGESQILKQVKGVLEHLLSGRQSLILTTMFRQAVHTGKRSRSETAIGRGNLSVSRAALALARNIFGEMSHVSALLVGAGEMGKLTANVFLASPVQALFVTSRSEARAQKLAEELQCDAISFHDILNQLKTVDILITCTGAARPILLKPEVAKVMHKRKSDPLIVLDLAVPRDVEEGVAEIENLYLYNIDDLQGIAQREKDKRTKEMTRVDLIVQQEAEYFCRWVHELKAKPLILKLLNQAEAIVHEEMQKHRYFLASLSPAQRIEVEQLLQQSINKVLHIPLTQLKALARDEYHEKLYLEVIRELFQVRL